ncbi:MAG: fasciclin domain-containing protein [Aggregatilineales bacterium]
MRRATLLVIFLALLTLLLVPAMAQDGSSVRIRVAHFSPDTPAVDVFVNGDAAITELAFPTVTDWIELPAGTYEIAVAPAGAGIGAAAIGPANFDLPAGGWITVAAVGSLGRGTLKPAVLVEDYTRLDAGQSRVTVFHGIEGVPPVDVLANGATAVQVLGFPGSLGSNDGKFALTVPAGVYDLSVIVTRQLAASPNAPTQVLFNLPDTRIDPDVNYFVAAVGTPAEPQIVIVPTTMPGASAQSLVDLALGNSRLSTLVAAVQAAGLVDELANGGPYTVFAPNNSAFEAAFAALGVTAEDVLSNAELLTQILLYHVVPGGLSAKALAAQGSVTTLEGSTITAEAASFGALLNGGVQIIRPDARATNGVLHTVDAVLLPPAIAELAAARAEAGPAILDVASANGFNTLAAAVRAAGLSSALNDPFAGPFTVFAPTDEAFAAALAALNMSPAALLANTDLLTQVLQYHVVSGRLPLAELVNAESVTTLQGEDIALSVEGTLELNGTAKVLTANVPASNGVIHAIDAVLLQPSLVGMIMAPAEAEAPAEPEQTTVGAVPQAETVIDIIAGDSRLSTLLAAAVAIDAPSALAEAGQVTILAPNNSAFAAALESLGLTVQDVVGQPELLRQILFYHIVPGGYSADELIAAGRLPTLEGNALDFRASSKTDFGAIINRFARILRPDRMAADGSYVHTINAVLLPPSVAEALGVTQDPGPTIAEVAAENGSFNTLVAALDAAGLAGTFNDPFAGPFTVFAPTDDAFAAALAALGLSAEELLANTELLTSVLNYHVVSGVVPAEEVVTLEKATTLQGADIAITVRDGNVILNDSVNVVLTNVQASNGIIHVIDAVLLPPSK